MSATVARSPAAHPRRRTRSSLSVALAILAAAALVLGGACLYARAEFLDSHAFAERTVAALGHEPVRRVIAREVVVQVIDQGSSDLIAARPLINSLVEAVVATPQFRGVVRLAAEQGHRLLFDRGGNVAFSIADAGTVVLSALRTLAPSVASKVPQNVDAKLLDLRKQSFAVKTLRTADKVRLLGLVLPLLALALLAIAIAIAPRRRLAVTRCAVALAVAAAAAFVDLLLVRHSLLVNLFGSDELSNGDVREAAGVLWESYVGDLSRWAFAVAAGAAIVATASANVLRPYTAGAGLARIRARVTKPHSPRGRALRGVLALAFAVVLLADPLTALDVLAAIGGVLLFYLGAGELLRAVGAAPEHERFSFVRSRAGALGAAASLGLLIGGAAIALAQGGNTDATPRAPAASALSTCNGYAQLCSRRVDQVAFPGTHNAMSAADSPGWFIANQSHGIARQLDDGIRAFKISTHYGVGREGNVRTDIAAAGEKVNRVSEKLDRQARTALQRLTQSVGFGPPKGTRAVWLCHTLCELGATSALSFFGTIRRFLQLNPGQVIVLFDEDYVSEASLEDVFKRSGLYSHLAVLREGQQLPTLGQLVRSQHNVLVFTQEPVSGRHPWNMYGFGGFIQDTPLGAVKPSQFSCKPFRGTAASPLLMMNDWADVFPPRRSPNVALTQRAFIVKRGRQCLAERHHLPNLILTDFYDSGDVVGAARVLNGLGEQRPAPIVPVRSALR
ncbi:MAG TPA: hypothetical protein VGX69_10090 [Solirubrobacteraceae bacterium]|nr:hypothetical protein [Solirubrobacteraceae bacterium]